MVKTDQHFYGPRTSLCMNAISDRVRSVTLTIALAIVGFGVGTLLVATGAGLLTVVGIPVFDRPAIQLVLSATLLQGIAFGGVALLYSRLGNTSPPLPVAVPSRRDLAIIVAGSVATLALWVGLSMTASFLGLDSATNQVVTTAAKNPAVLLLMIPLSYLLVGPGEELLFRGAIQGRLRSEFTPTVAIPIASATFAVLHVSSLSGDGKLVYLGGVFLIALVLGVLYEYTENLAVPALVHATYNAVQFGVAYFSLSSAPAVLLG